MNQKKLRCLSLSVFLSVLPSVSCAAEFKDTNSHWAKSYIEYFHDKKIVSGTGNHSFYPEQHITMESFLQTLYENINTSEPFLLFPTKEQVSRTKITESTANSKTEPSTENNTSKQELTTDKSGTTQEQTVNSEQRKTSTPQENTGERTADNNISSENSVKESSVDPVGYVPPTKESSVNTVGYVPSTKESSVDTVGYVPSTKESSVDTVGYVPPTSDLAIPFQNAYTEMITSKLYQNGLLQSFTLNDEFLPSPLNRQRVVLICKNYDTLRQAHNIYSDRTSKILEKTGWIDSTNGELLSPNQVLTRGEAMKIMYELFHDEELPHNYKVELNVTHISQMTPVSAPVGCEPVSLLMCLRSKGYCKDVSIRSYLDHVPRHKNDPEIAFAGSPYVPNQKLRTTIFPKPLAEYGKSYGADVVDLTGKNTEDLIKELYQGHPVVAYVTLYWKKPYYRTYHINGETRTYLRNNHALVVAGYDPSTKKFLIVDPYNVHGMKARYWIAETTFKPLYEVRKHAVSVR